MVSISSISLLVFFSILFLFFSALAQDSTNLTSGSDLLALFRLRSTLGLRARDWPRRSDPCSSWTGVSCRSGGVVSLRLSGLRRTRLGRLHPRFSIDGVKNLTRLELLDSTGFALPGPIPNWFGTSLPSPLSSLLLRSSSVTGRIPANLGNATALTSLDLALNFLTGSVPDSLWSLPRLHLLDLSGNNLTGTLPDVAPASAAGVFNLSNNYFYGTVSSEFAKFVSGRSTSVDLSGNYFQGPAPAAGNATFGFNCFRNAPNQRTVPECQEFYSSRGLSYEGPTAPPASSPSVSPPPALEKKSDRKKYILIGAIVGGVVALLVAFCVIVCCVMMCRRRKSEEVEQTSANVTSFGTAPSNLPLSGVSINLSSVGDSFTNEQLVRATSEFNDKNLIKHGHSGDLYYGLLENGAPVVVKRINVDDVRKTAYMTELEFFTKASHVRLVPFLGHCLENEKEKLIVYRYMPHGDLSNALYIKPGHEDDGLQSLDWITRLKIATGIAEALCFLHHECTPPFVHRDVQASSILLDDKFEVRLGSLSEACVQEGDDQKNVITRLLRLSSQSSRQSAPGSPSATCAYDVYCLGKVLLELVTGKLGISGSSDGSTSDWLERTLRYISIYEKELVTKIVDPSLIVDEDLLEEVWAMAIVARSCLNPKPSKRPLVRYILKALENPLKVVREENSGSARLRAGSSRGSWNAALFGSWRHSSSDIASISGQAVREDRSLRRSGTMKSQGSGGEQSFGRKRPSKEIFPEPSEERDSED